MNANLSGHIDPRFTAVRDAFAAGFSEGNEVGACVAAVVDGELVVDLWGGHTDRGRTNPWGRDTLCCVFSTTKGVAAMCILLAVARGLLRLDAPIANYWPEFARAGKEATTLRQLLSHRAGLPGLHQPIDAASFYDWQSICALLAAERPWWQPGAAHGYHARTFGTLLGAVLERVAGVRLSTWLARELTEPLGMDFHIGLGADELRRCATMLPARVRLAQQPSDAFDSPFLRDYSDITTPTGAAFSNPPLGPRYMNSDEFRRAELPSSGGHGNALALAKLYAAFVEQLPQSLLAEATTTHSLGRDLVLQATTHFGLGFMLHHSESPLGVGEGCFGHAGAGGSLAFYDTRTNTAFAYVMNQMEHGVISGGSNAMRVAQATFDCLG